MGRLIVYSIIGALAVFVLATVLIFKQDGEPSQAVMRVSAHDLSVQPQAHAEEHVITGGVLRLIQEPEEHFLLTDDGFGIVVRGYDPRELRRLAGEEVTVAGRFGFDEASGAYIEADSVTAAE